MLAQVNNGVTAVQTLSASPILILMLGVAYLPIANLLRALIFQAAAKWTDDSNITFGVAYGTTIMAALVSTAVDIVVIMIASSIIGALGIPILVLYSVLLVLGTFVLGFYVEANVVSTLLKIDLDQGIKLVGCVYTVGILFFVIFFGGLFALSPPGTVGRMVEQIPAILFREQKVTAHQNPIVVPPPQQLPLNRDIVQANPQPPLRQQAPFVTPAENGNSGEIKIHSNPQAAVKVEPSANPMTAPTLPQATPSPLNTSPRQTHEMRKKAEAAEAAEKEGYVEIPPDIQLVRGTPVMGYSVFSKWDRATILESIPGTGKVQLIWDNRGSTRTDDWVRSELKIRPHVLEILKSSDAAKVFGLRADVALHSKWLPLQYNKAGGYGINRPIPPNAVRVTKETPLEPGTRCGATGGLRWTDVSVLMLNYDDTVRIRWHDGISPDGDIDVECLIIAKNVLAKLEAKKKGTINTKKQDTTPESAANELEEDDKKIKKTEVKPSDEMPMDKVTAGKFQVVLKSYGSKKIPVTLVIRNATGLELKDAMTLVTKAPVAVMKDLDQEAAKKLRKEIEDAGGVVEVKPQ